MKKFLFNSAILLVLIITSLNVSAQQADTLKKKQNPTEKQRQAEFYGKKLSINQELAAKVTEIQNDFKIGVTALNSDSKLSEDAKRAKVNELIVEKINKLQAILTKDQLNQILPTSELDKVRGHSNPKKMN